MAKMLYLIFIIIILVCKSHQTNQTLNGTNNLVNSTVAIIGTGNIHLNQIYDGVNGIGKIFNKTDVYAINNTDDASNIDDNELSQIFNDETINSPRNSIVSLVQDDCINSETLSGPEHFPDDYSKIVCYRGEKGSIKLYQSEAYKPSPSPNPNPNPNPNPSPSPSPSPTPMYKQYKTFTIETLNSTSYIKFDVEVCTLPGGKVEIVKGEETDSKTLFRYVNTMSKHDCSKTLTLMADYYKILVVVLVPSDPPSFEEDSILKRSELQSEFPDPSAITLKIDFNEAYFTKDCKYLLYNSANNNSNNSTNNSTDNSIDYSSDYSSDNCTFDNPIDFRYKPNHVFTRILKSSDGTKKGVNITIYFLDLDFDVGDYMIVAGGEDPLQRPMSTAHIFTERIEKKKEKKIWVNANSAYIKVVTHNSLKKTGIKMKFCWKPPSITPDDTDKPKTSQRISEAAIHICLNSIRCENIGEKEEIIRENIAFESNEYFFKHNSETTNFVSKDNVLILDDRETYPYNHDNHEDYYCQLQVVLTSSYDDGWPLIAENGKEILSEIVFPSGTNSRTFKNDNETSTVAFTVTNCQNDHIELWKMLLPIGIILLVSITIMLLAWRYQYNSWMKEQKLLNSQYKKPQFIDEDDIMIFNRGKKNPIFAEIPNIEQHFPGDAKRQSNSIGDDDIDSGTSSMRQQNNYDIQNENNEFYDVFDENENRSNKLGESTNTFKFSNKILRQTSEESIPSSYELTSHKQMLGSITQHESLRLYPKSVLRKNNLLDRRPRTVSANEYVTRDQMMMTNAGNENWRNSKVRFEIPDIDVSSSSVQGSSSPSSVQGSSGLSYQGSSGLGYQGSSGLGYQGSSGLGYQGPKDKGFENKGFINDQ